MLWIIKIHYPLPLPLLRVLHLHSPPHCFPPNHEHHLLSFLSRHHCLRSSLQLHSHLVTSGLHRHHIGRRGILLWNTLIYRYSLHFSPLKSIHLYQHMIAFCAADLPTDSFTFAFLIKACTLASSAFPTSLQLHAFILKIGFASHVYVQTALLTMYLTWGSTADAQKVFNEITDKNSVCWNAMLTGLAKRGDMETASSMFSQMPNPNVISWTGLIDGYTVVGRPVESLSLFRQMASNGLSPSEITILAVIPSISRIGALDMGETLHAYCVKFGLDLVDVRVENSLIDMYSRCGSIKSAISMFGEMRERSNLVSYTSMLSAFAMHGMGEEAVQFFEQMEREKMKPNRVTFLSLLNACSHGGLVEEGVRFFRLMAEKHNVAPETKHYSCLIDMLGRAGKLHEAEQIITEMPVEVNAIVWRTMLGCCSKYGEVDMGKRVMARIMELERGYGGDYVVLSNMLTEADRFGEAEIVRRFVDVRNVVKVPGFSLT